MKPLRHRVLYVHNSADIYGASRSLLRLLPEMRSRGYDPRVVLPEDGPLKQRIAALGVEVIVDPWLAVINRNVFFSLRLVTFFLGFPISVLRLWRVIRQFKINLVHTNTGVMPAPALAARFAGVPHVWHIRDSFLEFRSLWHVYRRYISVLSASVIAVSNAIAAQFAGERNVTVIHNGMPLEEFPDDTAALAREFRDRYGLGDALMVGCVGRIKFVRKGQEVLIQAIPILKQRGLSAKFLLVGSPSAGNEDHLTRLQQLIQDLQIKDDVILTGELDDAKPAYAAMDVFVLPSAQPEPFGGVVLEAMAMKRPVIATAIGGSLDQVEEGTTGFLVPPADAAALADRLAILLQEPERRRAMGEAGYQRIAHCFSVRGMAEKIDEVYRLALNK